MLLSVVVSLEVGIMRLCPLMLSPLMRFRGSAQYILDLPILYVFYILRAIKMFVFLLKVKEALNLTSLKALVVFFFVPTQLHV